MAEGPAAEGAALAGPPAPAEAPAADARTPADDTSAARADTQAPADAQAPVDDAAPPEVDAAPRPPEAADGAAAGASAGEPAAAAAPRQPANGGGGLSASAPEFVPGRLPVAVEEEGTETDDPLAWLPPAHRALVRGYGYVGRLKSYSARNGYGFVECEQTWAQFGVDVFIHKSMIMHPWHIGQPLEFDVTHNSRGQPQAADVSWLPRLPPAPRAAGAAPPEAARTAAPQAGGAAASASGAMASSEHAGATRSAPPPAAGAEASAAAGAASPGSGGAAAASSAAAGGEAGAASAAGAPGTGQHVQAVPSRTRNLGTVKSYSPAQGYGFIACEDVYRTYQRDVYFHKAQLASAGWSLGQVVEFTVAPNARGQPQARDIDWDPVPHHTAEGAAAAAAGHDRVGAQALEGLREVLSLLSREPGKAVLKAVHLQGGDTDAGSSGRAEAAGDVDYVAYVLDRMGPEDTAAGTLNDLSRLILLLVCAKAMRKQRQPERCMQLARWFAALVRTIDGAAAAVKEHFRSVVGQIDERLQDALSENPCIDELGQRTQLSTAFRQLQAQAGA